MNSLHTSAYISALTALPVIGVIVRCYLSHLSQLSDNTMLLKNTKTIF